MFVNWHTVVRQLYDVVCLFVSWQPPLSMPHPAAAAALTSIHGSLPHFLPSPALASPVGSSSSQPGLAAAAAVAAAAAAAAGGGNATGGGGGTNAPCSTLFVANLGQFVSEHELKEIFSRSVLANRLLYVSQCQFTHNPHIPARTLYFIPTLFLFYSLIKILTEFSLKYNNLWYIYFI